MERVAVVGLAVRFPRSGADLAAFWENVVQGRDVVREVPAGRWTLPAEAVLHDQGPTPDRVPNSRGGYLDPFEPDLDGLAIDAALVRELDPLFHLVLDVGGRAWRMARTESIDRRRAGVVFGNICLPTEKSNDLARQYLGSGTDRPTHPLNRYPAGLPAGLLARALGFGGLAFTLDAACASSLYAIKLAADELLAGRADLMLAGGASRPDCLYTQMGFAQLRALSPRGVCSPFSSEADGLVVGEGAGLFVLKRVSDAVRAGDTIYATLAGAGLSNDVSGNLLAPAQEGQVRAMRAAYASANWQPSDVDLIECHATGTPVGDAVEFNSLCELWSETSFTPGQCVIGSVKSTVGHLLTGAGAAALAKVVLAMQQGVKPPQAHFPAANPNLDYEASPFRVLTEPQPWTPRSSLLPRRAAVSGFGFGGVNAHLLFEEWRGEPLARTTRTTNNDPIANEPIAIVGLGVQVGPWNGVREFQEYVLGGGKPAAAKPRVSGWAGAGSPCPPGHFLESLAVPADRFRIPPKELEEMLPQQLLVLQTAAAALEGTGQEPQETALRTGVFIGLGLDLNTTNYHLRWADSALSSVPRSPFPPLNADRVMGALGSIAASRIARAFGFGGPSFTVCSEETSAGRAIELAVRALRRGELDRALAGGVELCGDPRAILAAHQLKPYAPDGLPLVLGAFGAGAAPADGAAVLVLKRLSDAEKDGDRIVALITGVGSAVGGAAADLGPDADTHAASLLRACADGRTDPATLAHFDTAAAGTPADDQAEAEALARLATVVPLALGASRATVGHTGFASAAVGVAKTALALYQQILPPFSDVGEARSELSGFDFCTSPRYWLTDAGPRRAAVAAAGIDGTAFHCVLEEYVPKVETKRMATERRQPLGALAEAVFALEGDTAAELLDGLIRLLEWLPTETTGIEALARAWHRRVPAEPKRLAVAFVARSVAELKEQIDTAQSSLVARPDWPLPDPAKPDPRGSFRDRIFYNPYPLGRSGKLAFVFPGSGNHFNGMGRDLGVLWPQVLRRQQSENQSLRAQYAPSLFWSDEIPAHATPCDFLFGQVTFGTLAADLLVGLGVTPQALIGPSLGESAGLFGLRIWTARDEMHRRLHASPLFRTDLGPPYNSARSFFNLKTGEPFEWVSGIVAAGADDVRVHLRPGLNAYLLIVSGPNECVIGGSNSDVLKLAAAVAKPLFKLQGVTLAHCELGAPVQEAYRDLHRLPVTAGTLKVYSGSWAKPYALTEQNCADSITAGLLNTIDVPHLIETAYRDGVRAFVEVGPGSSTTRTIDAILGDRPHVARTIAAPRQDAASQVLRLLARLIAERFPVNLNAFYGPESTCAGHREKATVRNVIRVRTGFEANITMSRGRMPSESEASESETAVHETEPAIVKAYRETPGAYAPGSYDLDFAPFIAAATATASATATAHAKFLAVQQGFTATAVAAVQLQNDLVARLLGREPALSHEPPRSLTLAQCQAFAAGRVGDVLGPLFADADNFPTRVRLPDGPLMLVDRILTIEGEPKSLTSGRVVTDHTVHADRWYLDAGRAPVSVTVEAGQADLFLSGFLGIDFETRGLAVYRLLDAVVTFHRGLPKVGERIVYDIHIDGFFRQADAWLFRFRFEGTIDGQPMLSMASGVAGFFTAAALAAGQGIIHTKLDLQMVAGKVVDFTPLVPVQNCSLDAAAVDALRRGDYEAAFGPDFAVVQAMKAPMSLPGGMLKLVDRVPRLEPHGGRFGLGFIQAEYDLRPREWFIECHFIDDKVMPGTLMYECCLHTLRIFLHRQGWLGEAGTVCEPVPGVASRLKCRGQVLETTKRVTYEVSIKEIGYRPEPYAIADALMYADGKPIVEITSLSLRMNLSKNLLESLWEARVPHDRLPKSALGLRNLDSAETYPRTSDVSRRRFDHAAILAYSNGKPSEAFGAPYKIFDDERIIARLPGPPYQFLDRIIDAKGEPFVLAAGAACTAEYEVPPDAWYFTANRSSLMPFSILLEIALQPCGWLAAYCGSALTSPDDLSFRNLGGDGVQHRAVTPQTGLLTTTVTMTKVSTSAGMIIQHYDMTVSDNIGVVYDGKTYFGFFAKDALKNQVGMPTAKVPFLTDEQKHFADAGVLPQTAPFPEPMLRMVDVIDGWLPQGGRAGLGLLQGRIAVDPEFWFFKAHFYQDPVWPGSLGLESFLQLLKYAAWKKWTLAPTAGWQTAALGRPHQWSYRGQVLPTDREVTVVLEITAENRVARTLTADGFLTVDGRIIYQMTSFTLE